MNRKSNHLLNEHLSPVMQYLLLKAFLATKCNAAVLLQVFQLIFRLTVLSGQTGESAAVNVGPHREPLCSPVQKVLLAELQDLHVPHVLEKDISFGDHLLQFLKAFPQCQVVLQPTLLDLININHNELISLVTR